ncbi:hypothetical protein B188_10920 [Candidatus Brocadiaceae bacterium B188]|nr:hypothetical protein B188_10920 [Candidatus Brocadiaceae bacterium B188]
MAFSVYSDGFDVVFDISGGEASVCDDIQSKKEIKSLLLINSLYLILFLFKLNFQVLLPISQ